MKLHGSHLMILGLLHSPVALAEPVSRTTIVTAAAPQVRAILSAHNRERAMVGVPPLVWDTTLGTAAQTYADFLAVTGQFQHAPKADRPNQAENLWRGNRGYFSVVQMVGTWAAEKRLFKPGVYPAVSITGSWYDVSHYTQVIWRKTDRVGCGISSTKRSDYLVCRYSPKGNQNGNAVP